MTYNIQLSDYLNLLVCYNAHNLVIGKDGDLPWKRSLTADLKFVNHLTSNTNAAIIMGRKTFESIGRPLPNRVNIVISNTNINNKNVMTFRSLDSAVEWCMENKKKAVFFGGQKIYEEAISKFSFTVFATIVFGDFDGDVFFPKIECDLTDITAEVHSIFEQKKITNYELKDGFFLENGIRYKFYMGRYENKHVK